MVSRKAKSYIPAIVARSETLDAEFISSVWDFIDFQSKNQILTRSIDEYLKFAEASDRDFYIDDLSKRQEFIEWSASRSNSFKDYFEEICAQLEVFETLSAYQINEIKKDIEKEETQWRKRRGESFDEFANFSDPLTKADYDYWFSVPAWDEYECAILSVGSDPRKINENDFAGHPTAKYSNTVINYNRILSSVRLAMHTADLKELVKPAEFMAFAESHRLPVDPMMINTFKIWSNPRTKVIIGSIKDNERVNSRTTYRKIIYVLTSNLLDGNNVKYDKDTIDLVLSLFEDMPFDALSESAVRSVLVDVVKFYEMAKDERDHG